VKLLVIRHGPAEDPESWEAEGRDDRLRPLTPEGKKEVRRAVQGLATLVRTIDVLASSPLVRAVQTADVIAAEYGTKITTVDVLTPESDPDKAVQWLKQQPVDATIAMVGHEPHQSMFVGYLLTGTPASVIELKKAGACLLELENPIKPGRGALQWLLAPKMLRKLGG
jgi:phosphohistidine phosphatase